MFSPDIDYDITQLMYFRVSTPDDWSSLVLFRVFSQQKAGQNLIAMEGAAVGGDFLFAHVE